MNKIKNQLIKSANKQEIHDNSKQILSKVDTSRVIVAPAVTEKKLFSFRFTSLACASFAALVVLGVVGGIGLSLNKPHNEISSNDKVIAYSGGELTEQVIYEAASSETYALINVASSFGKVSFDKVECDGNPKRLSATEEKSLAGDLNAFMYNIEYMYGMSSQEALESINTNLSIPFDKVVEVSNESNDYSYYYYFTEKIVLEQNTMADPTYRRSSTISGLLVFDDNEYDVVGTKDIKNGILTYTTTIKISSELSVTIEEEFGKNQNSFEYSFYKNNAWLKDIVLVQKIDLEGKTEAIKFKSRNLANTESGTYEESINEIKLVDRAFRCSVQSRSSEVILIENGKAGHLYTFKNSNNKYVL